MAPSDNTTVWHIQELCFEGAHLEHLLLWHISGLCFEGTELEHLILARQ